MFGIAKSVRNAIKSKYPEIRRGITFDGEGSWSFDNDFARDVGVFGVDDQKNNFLVLDEGSTQGINDSTGLAEK